jgi:hypothetical protein
MQTFLPYANFINTAYALDRRRLGKQRIETKQILLTLTGESEGWKNHPAVKMWKGYEMSLAFYGSIICIAWKSYGYKDNQLQWFKDTYIYVGRRFKKRLEHPPWLGDQRVHSSHRAALLHKDYEHYSQFGWREEPKLNYYWPKEETNYEYPNMDG